MPIEAVNYQFQYYGALPDGAHDQDTISPTRNIIKLYRQPIARYPELWSIKTDFPKPLEPLPEKKHCASFFDLIGLINESDALARQKLGQKRPNDDWLIFSRSLRDAGNQPASICPEERELVEKFWTYNCMGVDFSAIRLVPEYFCKGCGETNYAGDYNRMINSTIAYVGHSATEYSDENDPKYQWPGNYSWSDLQLDEMFKIGTIQGR